MKIYWWGDICPPLSPPQFTPTSAYYWKPHKITEIIGRGKQIKTRKILQEKNNQIKAL
jgi:hypothetical protein